MTNIIDTITRENMICIAYCKKAIKSPTCICSASIRRPPYQMIATEDRFMTSIIIGIINAITLLTLIEVSVKSRFASPKRFFS
ncbi:hypothetical protein D3C81_1620370 [compost metagenome]